MATIAEIRRQYPQYNDLSDQQIADSLRNKYYRDIPKSDFYSRVGLETSPLRDIGGAGIVGVGQVISLPGQLAGLATGDFDNVFTRAGRDVEEFGTGIQSEAFRAQQEEAAQRVQRAEEEGGFFSGAGQQIKELVTDPLAFAAGIAQTAPSMIGTGGAALLGRAVAGRLAREGIEQAARRAALNRGTQIGAGTGAGALTGGDSGSSTYERVMQMPQETLEAAPAYREAVASGLTPEEARQEVALSSARQAALPAAALAAVTTGLGGVESALIGGNVARGFVRGGLQTGAKEAGQEFVEEGGAALSENIALGEVDPTIQPLDNVGSRGAMGAVLGFGASAPAGAIAGLRGAEEDATTPPPEGETVTPPEPPTGGAGVGPSPVPDGPAAPPVGGTGPAATPTGGPVGPVGTGVVGVADVIIDEDGTVTATMNGGDVRVFTPDEWREFSTANAAPVAEPVVTPAPEPAPVEPPPVSEPVVTPAPPPVSEPSAPVTPVTPPAAPGPVPVAAVEKPTEVTKAEFRAANTPTFGFEKAVVGKSLPDVARWLSQNAQLPTTRSLMGRAAGILDYIVQSGVELQFGISGQANPNIASKVAEQNANKASGLSGISNNGAFLVGIAGNTAPFPGTEEITVSHEIIHTITRTAIDQPQLFPAKSRIRQAATELKSLTTDIKDFILKDTSPAGLGLRRTNDWFNYRTDPNEIIAWGLTDYKFQQYLKTVPVKKSNAFTNFVRYIGKLIGVGPKDYNALRSLIELTEEIIPEREAGKKQVGRAVKKHSEGIASGVLKLNDATLMGTPDTSEAAGEVTLTPYKDVALSVMWFSGGSRTAVAGAEKPSWVPDDVVVYDKTGIPPATNEKPDVRVDSFRAKDGTVGKKVTVSVPSVDEKFGDRGNTASATLWIRDSNPKYVDSVIQVADVIARWVADPKNSKAAGPLNNVADEAIKFVAAQGGMRAAPAASTSSGSVKFDDATLMAINPGLILPGETFWQKKEREFLDRLSVLKRVEGLGNLINRSQSAYEAARRFDSVAGGVADRFRRDYFNPITEGLLKVGITLNEFDHYLWARAAPDRNARVKRDDGKPSSGIEDVDADFIVSNYENGPKGAEYLRIAAIFDKMNAERRRIMVQRGLISQDTLDVLESLEPKYAPMQGRAQSAADLTISAMEDDSLMNYGGSGFSVSRNEWKKTRGRSTPPFSPLSIAFADAQTSIVRGERNRVGNLFLNFAARNPSAHWRIFSEANPPRDSRGNRVAIDPRDPRWLVTKRGGKSFFVRIDNPILSRAVKNTSAEELNPVLNNGYVRFVTGLTRAFSRSLTTANPVFFVPNFARDLQAAYLNLSSEVNGKQLTKGFITRAFDPKFRKAIADIELNRKNGTATAADRRLYEQFKEDGGSIGWIQRDRPEDIANRLKKDFEKLQLAQQNWEAPRDFATARRMANKAFNPFSNGVRSAIDYVEGMNSVFENSIRFAAYRAALEAHPQLNTNPRLARNEAAMLSRDVTVDFNKAGEAGRALNTVFAFLNAGIQGAERTLRSVSNNPFKTGKVTRTQAIIGGIAGLAAVLATMNAAMSDEDDDGELFYDKIPDYVKERNLILMSLDGRNYVKIPMPYGFAFFPYVATRITDAIRKGDDVGDVAGNLFSAVLTNFSPIQFQSDNVPEGVIKAITPTLGKPFIDLMLNSNFVGKPIYNEPFDKSQSIASAARYGTPERYKWFAQFLNDMTGGEGKSKGKFDVPAEGLEYLWDFAFAGPTQWIGGLWKLASEEPSINSAPLLNKIAGSPQEGRNIGRYYERAGEIQGLSLQMRSIDDPVRLRDFKRRHPVETSPSVQSAMTTARAQVRDLNKQRTAIQKSNLSADAKDERLKRIKERYDQVFVRFNTAYNREAERQR